MPIVLVRIDDRLVHGQVVEGWLKIVNVDTILVVSDVVARDTVQQILMSMAVTENVKLVVKNLKDATDTIKSRQHAKEKIMILTVSPSDILYMIDNGINFRSVNVGGMHFMNGKRQLLYNLFVDDNDVENLYKICNRGVKIEGRILPKDQKTNIMRVIEKEYLAIRKKVK
jgi:PTS system mannose-specific IIB component